MTDNRLLKQLVYHGVSNLALQRLSHRLLMPDRLAILMYHGVVDQPLAVEDWCFLTTQQFSMQMHYLQKYFNVVPLSRAFEYLARGDSGRPLAAITFDDGYQNNFTQAFPVLTKLGLPATVFLNTGLVDSDDTVWFCRLHQALTTSCKPYLDYDQTRYDLTTPQARKTASVRLQEKLKKVPQVKFFNTLAKIVADLGEAVHQPLSPDSPFRMLNRGQIRRMAESGLIEFGAHTDQHIILSSLNREQQYQQIELSIDKTARLSGYPCRLFAYPNGGPDDYDRHSIELLKASGVSLAVTTKEGANDLSTPKYELKRYGIGADTGFARFKTIVHHLYHTVQV